MAKKRNRCFILLLLLFISACTHEGIEIPYFDFIVYSPGPQDSGNASANVFDKTWRATAYIFPNEQDTQFMAVRFETYSPEGFIRDEVFFGNFALKEGSYSVVDDSSAGILQDDYVVYGGHGQYQDDGDVLIGAYILDQRYQNNLFIDRIDTVAHIIEGRFNALFKLREEYSHHNIAKLILFKDGEYTVNY